MVGAGDPGWDGEEFRSASPPERAVDEGLGGPDDGCELSPSVRAGEEVSPVVVASPPRGVVPEVGGGVVRVPVASPPDGERELLPAPGSRAPLLSPPVRVGAGAEDEDVGEDEPAAVSERPAGVVVRPPGSLPRPEVGWAPSGDVPGVVDGGSVASTATGARDDVVDGEAVDGPGSATVVEAPRSGVAVVACGADRASETVGCGAEGTGAEGTGAWGVGAASAKGVGVLARVGVDGAVT